MAVSLQTRAGVTVEWQENRRGQAALELALVLPLLVLLTLGVLQWSQLQGAGLLMEYAAFSAARAGAVWNGSHPRMRGAALFALLPTVGRTDSAESLWRTRQQQARLDDGLARWFGGDSGAVRVEVVEPTAAGAEAPPGWQELEFDQSLERPRWISIRLRAWYELRIPVADAAVFWAWWLYQEARASSFSSNAGLPLLNGAERSRLQALARGEGALEDGRVPVRRYFLPLVAEHRLRMHSSFYRKWVMQ